MRITWNNDRFEAEIPSGEHFRDDIETIKAAGFRTSGPPQWCWYTTKAAPINKLRDPKPKTGLTLTELALSKYKQLDQEESSKAALKKQYQQLRRKADKQSKDTDISGMVEFVFPEKGYIDVEDLSPVKSNWVPPVFKTPDIYCVVCGDPLYTPFPDYPDICIWCNKLQNTA